MSAINKRQQARLEKALDELVRSVPGNDRCADCQARNPGSDINIARHIPLHAMRRAPQEARNAHFKGQVAEHGRLDD
ncbi:hypothetical protein MRB53_037089 [Persea americana]|nr:hypothetical protein MRB53_037089 [Persea americana]